MASSSKASAPPSNAFAPPRNGSAAARIASAVARNASALARNASAPPRNAAATLGNPSHLFLPELPGLARDPNEFFQSVQNDPTAWWNFLDKLYSFGTYTKGHLDTQIMQNRDLLGSLNAMNIEVNSLYALFDELRACPAAPDSSAPESSVHLSEKLPDIPMFGGERSEFVTWISQLYVKLAGNHDHFTSPQAKLMYAMSRLEGNALAQTQPYVVNSTTTLFGSVNELLQLLERAFGDPDPTATAQECR